MEFKYDGDLNTEWETVSGFDDYEIRLVDGYAEIRKKEGMKPLKYTFDKQYGYYKVSFNRKPYQLHRIIATQYINHDSQCDKVDHMDRIRTNNHILNLRWTTQKVNTINKAKPGRSNQEYEIVDILPNNALGVIHYGNHFLRNYFYADNKFYFYTGSGYRVLPKLKNSKDSYFVRVRDTNNVYCNIFYNKWYSMNEI